MSPWRNRTPARPSLGRLSSLPRRFRLSRTVTSTSGSVRRKRIARFEPTNPAPPVISTLLMFMSRRFLANQEDRMRPLRRVWPDRGTRRPSGRLRFRPSGAVKDNISDRPSDTRGHRLEDLVDDPGQVIGLLPAGVVRPELAGVADVPDVVADP